MKPQAHIFRRLSLSAVCKTQILECLFTLLSYAEQKVKFSKNVKGKVQITQEFTVGANTNKSYEEKARQGMKKKNENSNAAAAI